MSKIYNILLLSKMRSGKERRLGRAKMLYAFTSGIIDQMGGPKGWKLSAKGLWEWLLSLWGEPVAKRAERFVALFEA